MSGVTVVCVGCGASAHLPEESPGHVRIDPLNGWTAPPPLCPSCSTETGVGHDRPAAQDGRADSDVASALVLLALVLIVGALLFAVAR